MAYVTLDTTSGSVHINPAQVCTIQAQGDDLSPRLYIMFAGIDGYFYEFNHVVDRDYALNRILAELC